MVSARCSVVWKDVGLVEHDPNDGDQRVGGAGGAAIEQFQRAALDAVRAARALLDAAESVIQEPAAIEAMVDTVASVAKTATDAVAGFAASGMARSSGVGSDDDEDDPPGGFEHISVD